MNIDIDSLSTAEQVWFNKIKRTLIVGGWREKEINSWFLRQSPYLGRQSPLDELRNGGHYKVFRIATELASDNLFLYGEESFRSSNGG